MSAMQMISALTSLEEIPKTSIIIDTMRHSQNNLPNHNGGEPRRPVGPGPFNGHNPRQPNNPYSCHFRNIQYNPVNT